MLWIDPSSAQRMTSRGLLLELFDLEDFELFEPFEVETSPSLHGMRMLFEVTSLSDISAKSEI